jgi:hypothetical protein
VLRRFEVPAERHRDGPSDDRGEHGIVELAVEVGARLRQLGLDPTPQLGLHGRRGARCRTIRARRLGHGPPA